MLLVHTSKERLGSKVDVDVHKFFSDKIIVFFTEFIEKLHSTYQALISGTYRPGQIVIVPTLSRPTQHKTQQPAHTAPDAAQVSPEDGVEVHSFLEAILQIIHTSNGSFRYNPF